MKDNMMELYRQLNLDNQRNEFSALLIKVDKLLDEILSNKKIPKNSEVKNYDVNKGVSMSEKDILAFFYEDLWNIKNKILSLMILDNK